MSYYKLIELIKNPEKQIQTIVFSPHHNKSKISAFAKVNFSSYDRYEVIGSNGITTYGYFKYCNELYIVLFEYNQPHSFYVCDYAKESDDYINYSDKKFIINDIPKFVL